MMGIPIPEKMVFILRRPRNLEILLNLWTLCENGDSFTRDCLGRNPNILEICVSWFVYDMYDHHQITQMH